VALAAAHVALGITLRAGLRASVKSTSQRTARASFVLHAASGRVKRRVPLPIRTHGAVWLRESFQPIALSRSRSTRASRSADRACRLFEWPSSDDGRSARRQPRNSRFAAQAAWGRSRSHARVRREGRSLPCRSDSRAPARPASREVANVAAMHLFSFWRLGKRNPARSPLGSSERISRVGQKPIPI